jgi:hypothetical protein
VVLRFPDNSTTVQRGGIPKGVTAEDEKCCHVHHLIRSQHRYTTSLYHEANDTIF